jgi:hypothetical protein
VGIPPAGSINRCRLYVPARTLWGALTAELARHHAASGFPDYPYWGKELRDKARFTYLYPAEWDGQVWRAWLPCFEPNKGLVWVREGSEAEGGLADRQMRMRLLSTRAATAIDPESDTAAEGSLRETECINTHWRDENTLGPDETGRPAGPLAFKGYLWFRNEHKLELDAITRITVGGDTRYGFGRLRRMGELEPATSVFGFETELTAQEPIIVADRLLAHGEVASQQLGQSETVSAATVSLCGAQEALGGWDHSNRGLERIARPLWAPGSKSKDKQRWRLTAQGVWSLAEMNTVEMVKV